MVCVIPFSAESKQGREEIWQIVESVIELPQGYIEAENAKREAKQKQPAPQEPKKKERWKKTDRPVAKKTLRKEQYIGLSPNGKATDSDSVSSWFESR